MPRMIERVKEMAEMKEATKLANQIAETIADIVNDSGQSPATVHFLLWVGLCRALAQAGWTADELVKDLRWHVEDQMKDEAGI